MSIFYNCNQYSVSYVSFSSFSTLKLEPITKKIEKWIRDNFRTIPSHLVSFFISFSHMCYVMLCYVSQIYFNVHVSLACSCICIYVQASVVKNSLCHKDLPLNKTHVSLSGGASLTKSYALNQFNHVLYTHNQRDPLYLLSTPIYYIMFAADLFLTVYIWILIMPRMRLL